jgi:hypothetical protein
LLHPGDTFHYDGHLWVALTKPDANGNVVCVSFTTQRPKSDTTTVCAAGEHRFIDRPTVVAYNYAMQIPTQRINRFLDGGTFSKREPCSPELFKKVLDGLQKSPRTPNFIRSAMDT